MRWGLALLTIATVAQAAPLQSQSEIDAINRAHVASGEVRDGFKKALGAALAKGGAKDALPECRVALPKSDEVLSVGRTSHRLRNPANAPQEWMKPYLKKFSHADKTKIPKQVLVRLGNDRYGYLEPIFVEPICLNCHGSGLSPELIGAIKKDYPHDQAVGFKEGDFRGLLWLEMKAPEPEMPTRTTDFEPLSIMVKNCAGCHQKEDHPGALFLNRQRLSDRQTMELIVNVIEANRMPPAHKKFGRTNDGKKLLKWMKGELARSGGTSE